MEASEEQKLEVALNGYGGWLAFYCFCAMYLSPAAWILALLSTLITATNDKAIPWWLDALSLLFGLIIVALNALAGLQLRAKIKDAPKFARTVLVTGMLCATVYVAVFTAATWHSTADWSGELFEFPLGIGASVAWFSYFKRSKRIKAMFSTPASS